MRFGPLARRTARRARQSLVRRVHRDLGGGPEAAVLVAGTARSGTTWVGEQVARALAARLIFEPFHPERVPACAEFGLFPYRRPDQPDLRLERFAEAVLSGEIRGSWVDRYTEVWRPRRRVVKEIRANLCLARIKRWFPQVPLVFVLRHPCAVVASRMALGWATDADLAPLLAQPDLLEDHLGARAELVGRASRPEEKHALLWCVTNGVPLAQLAPGEAAVVFYEHLCRDPAAGFSDLVRRLDGGSAAPSVARAARASMTAVGAARADPRRGLGAWQSRLTRDEIDRVLALVRAWGLGHLYGEAPEPLLPATPDGEGG